MTSLRIVFAALAISLAVPSLASDVSSDRTDGQATDTTRHAASSADAAKAAPVAPATICTCRRS